MLTWPDDTTPWYDLPSVQVCYVRIISEIAKHEKVLLVTTNPMDAMVRIMAIMAAESIPVDLGMVQFAQCPINDTWSRDHGPIAVWGDDGEKFIYDFIFNGWGLKFASNLDNQITKTIFMDGNFDPDVLCVDMRPFVLEGGSIDTDGAGTLLTTTSCLTSLNRNEYLTREEIEGELCQAFGLERVLWLENGSIEGDDTDGHVDILARFCSKDTIAYCSCDDPDDVNFLPLKKMEKQLRSFRTLEGKPYKLIPLPLPEPIFLEGERLPASYANFLILEDAVLVPGTGGDELERQALSALQEAFPTRKVSAVDCRPLLSGHGGLHCVTMQLPEGYMR